VSGLIYEVYSKPVAKKQVIICSNICKISRTIVLYAQLNNSMQTILYYQEIFKG